MAPNAGLKSENPPKMPEIREFAVEMTLGGRESEFCDGIFLPALQAWKAAQNAASHIPTATAAAES
jgi:hypothetical protein